MSVLVFAVGLALVTGSAIAIIGGQAAATIFGPGETLISGLAVMLLVIYASPLKDIRSSITDLGSANAVFIAYMHQVSEISHTLSGKYLAKGVDYEDLDASCKLLSQAARDVIDELRRARKGPGKPDASRVTRTRTVGKGKRCKAMPKGFASSHPYPCRTWIRRA